MAAALLAALVGLGLLATGAPAAGAAEDRPPRRVALVLVRDLTWSTAPPALDGFAKANVSMRSAEPSSGAADTYLTLGKGARAAALEAGGVGRVDRSPYAGARLLDWGALADRDAGLHHGGRLGSVGAALEHAGLRWGVAGDDERAAAAAANAAGVVPRRFQDVDEALGAPLDAWFLTVAVWDLARVLDRLDGTCTLVVSASTPDANRRLGVLAASRRCGLGVGGLFSPSTHQDHLATLPDASATFLGLLGVPAPAGVTGAVVAPAADVARPGLVERAERAWTADHARPGFVWLFIALHAVGAVVAVRVPRLRALLCCALLSIPAASFLMMLVPWWRAGPVAGLAVGGTVAGLLAAGAAVLVRRDVVLGIGALTAFTSAVVGLDALLASPLQVDAPFGNSPVSAGRFFGVGNIGSGFLVAGLLVTGALALQRWGRRALPWVAAALVGGTVAGGAPQFGADVGGVLYAVPAYGLLLAGALHKRFTARHLALLAASALVAVAVFALVDLVGGADTHLATLVADGGLADAVLRKAALALRTVTMPIAALVVIAAAALSTVRRPTLGLAWRALVAAAVLGSVLNDSGAIVAAAVVAVAWPAGVALAPTRRAARGPAPQAAGTA